MSRSTAAVADRRIREAYRLVLAGNSRKEIAFEIGVGSSHVHRILRDLGIIRADLTKEEHDLIAQRRGVGQIG